jgi:hypothetical protein
MATGQLLALLDIPGREVGQHASVLDGLRDLRSVDGSTMQRA